MSTDSQAGVSSRMPLYLFEKGSFTALIDDGPLRCEQDDWLHGFGFHIESDRFWEFLVKGILSVDVFCRDSSIMTYPERCKNWSYIVLAQGRKAIAPGSRAFFAVPTMGDLVDLRIRLVSATAVFTDRNVAAFATAFAGIMSHER